MDSIEEDEHGINSEAYVHIEDYNAASNAYD